MFKIFMYKVCSDEIWLWWDYRKSYYVFLVMRFLGGWYVWYLVGIGYVFG